MAQSIKIGVIGAAGKSGKYILNLLLHKGLDCKILLRHPENFQIQNSKAEIVEGDVRHYDAVQKLLRDCNIVVSTLGQAKGETPVFSQAAANVIAAVDEFNISRYIVITGLSVNTPFDRKGPATKAATDWMYNNYPATTHDKQVEYEMMAASPINWTLIRLPLIEQTECNNKILVDLEDCPSDKISATSLAHFIVDQFFNDAYIGKAPFIANA